MDSWDIATQLRQELYGLAVVMAVTPVPMPGVCRWIWNGVQDLRKTCHISSVSEIYERENFEPQVFSLGTWHTLSRVVSKFPKKLHFALLYHGVIWPKAFDLRFPTQLDLVRCDFHWDWGTRGRVVFDTHFIFSLSENDKTNLKNISQWPNDPRIGAKAWIELSKVDVKSEIFSLPALVCLAYLMSKKSKKKRRIWIVKFQNRS